MMPSELRKRWVKDVNEAAAGVRGAVDGHRVAPA